MDQKFREKLFPDGRVPSGPEMREATSAALGGKEYTELDSGVLSFLVMGGVLELASRSDSQPHVVAEALAAALGSPWMLERMLTDAVGALAETQDALNTEREANAT